MFKPGTAGGIWGIYASGKTLDNCLLWRIAADHGEKIEVMLPKVDLHAYLPVRVEGLHDNWSVFLSTAHTGVGLPPTAGIEEGAYARFLRPVGRGCKRSIHRPPAHLPNRPERRKLLVTWERPGHWFVEAHNPTDRTLTTRNTHHARLDILQFHRHRHPAPRAKQNLARGRPAIRKRLLIF